jgi:hypothetical protein
MALGNLAKKINSSKFQVYITSVAAGNELLLLQNARMLISHSEFREPNNSGTNALYSGNPDNIISGTVLMSTDLYSAFLTAALTRTNGEVAQNTWIVKLIGADASALTYSFANTKVSITDFSKPTEGGVKVDISLIPPGDPTIS